MSLSLNGGTLLAIVESDGSRFRVTGETVKYCMAVSRYSAGRKTITRRGKRFNIKIGPRIVRIGTIAEPVGISLE